VPVNAWGQIYIGSSAPQEDPVQVGSLWTDTVNNLLKRCTSVSPYTWVSTEGGSAAHALDSATHTGVAAMTEAKGMLIAHDGANWLGLSVGANGQVLEADSVQSAGVKWATPSGGGSHTLDSASHTDVAALTEAAGDLLVHNGSLWANLAKGAEGQALVVGGFGDTPLKWLTLGLRRTGRAHGIAGSRANILLAADTMRAVPFVTTMGTYIDAIGIDIQTAGGAGSNVKLAVYSDDGNGYPAAILSGTTSAELDTSSTGLKRTAFTPTFLAPNTLYWIVVHTDATATPPTARCTQSDLFERIVGWADNTNLGNTASGFWSVARTYDGTMPSTFPSGATAPVTNGSNNSYALLVEVG
jgi:hypothetical protein